MTSPRHRSSKQRGSKQTGGKRPYSRAHERAHLLADARNTHVPGICDVCVVGGGAAGLTAAICAAEAGACVVVLEGELSCAQKILATGNGRCNFAHTDLCAAHYTHPDFVGQVLGDAPLADILGFFSDCGLVWFNQSGWLYPRSFQAASVRTVLLERAEQAGVVLAGARRVTEIRPVASSPAGSNTNTSLVGNNTSTDETNTVWTVMYQEGWDAGQACSLDTRAVVLASGGGSSALRAPETLTWKAWEPILCGLAASSTLFATLDGRRCIAEVHLVRDNTELMSEQGEVLFRTGGLSGIVMFNVSRLARPGDRIELDLVPELSEEELARKLAHAQRAVSTSSTPGATNVAGVVSAVRVADAMGAADASLPPSVHAALSVLIDPKLPHALEDAVWYNPTGTRDYSAYKPDTNKLAPKLARLVKHVCAEVTGKLGSERAQVMRGGLCVDGFDPTTLELQPPVAPGLFACGEVIDVDGPCGGYNLAWAWTSGMRAGKAAARASLSMEEKRRPAEKQATRASAHTDEAAAHTTTKTQGEPARDHP